MGNSKIGLRSSSDDFFERLKFIYIVRIYAEGGESMPKISGKHSFLGAKRVGVRTFLIGFFE